MFTPRKMSSFYPNTLYRLSSTNKTIFKHPNTSVFCVNYFQICDFLTSESLFSGHYSMTVNFPQYSSLCTCFTIFVANIITPNFGLFLVCLGIYLSSYAVKTFLALFLTLLVRLMSFFTRQQYVKQHLSFSG